MQRIYIKNFGPISEAELEIKDYMFFIGPQASGKSTISKCIFFFKTIKDDLIRYLVECLDNQDFDKPLGSFGKKIRHKFLDYWGTSFHLSDIIIKYYYTPDIWISIKLEKFNKYITPTFSLKFRNSFHELIQLTEAFSKKTHGRNKAFLTSKDLFNLETLRKSFITAAEKKISIIFQDEKELVFIPAGRSLMATLSDHLQAFDSRKMDFIMRAFIDKISSTKSLFNKSLNDIIKQVILLSKTEINRDVSNFAEKIISEILKGKYQYDSDGEKIYFSEDKFTRLSHSSSGQQESIWILLLIFLYIVENREVFMVIEEPEAHLYPSAQKNIIELITLLANLNNNQIIITTHSPYILASLNNLIYAHQLGSKKPTQIERIINKQLWLDINSVSAFQMINGKIESIIDDELKLLKVEDIDKASSSINSIFDNLYSIDNNE